MPKPKPLSSKRGEVRELTIADMKAGKPLPALQGPLKGDAEENRAPRRSAPGSSCITVASRRPTEVRDFCRGEIANYKIPCYIEFVDAFPMTITGKIQKFVMREQTIEKSGLKAQKTA